MWVSLVLHVHLLHELDMPKMRGRSNMNPYHEPHIVRIRHKATRSRYHNKAIYRYHRYGLTIPSKYKDLKVEAKQEGNALIIEAKPVRRTRQSHLARPLTINLILQENATLEI